MRQLFVLFVAVIAVCTQPPGLNAARDIAAEPGPPSKLKLVVMEVEGCIYCGHFRRLVLPVYESSPRAKQVPITFVDMNDEAAKKLYLLQPVHVVPTVLLMRGNQEVERITGFIGRENFFRVFNRMVQDAQ